MPSLGTATKLARGLRELRDEDDGPQYLRLVGAPSQNPTARVEYSLRADEVLSEAHVRQVMEYYLAIRRRRLERTFPAMAPSNLHAAPVNEPAPKPAGGHSTENSGNGHANSHTTAGRAGNGQEAVDRSGPGSVRPLGQRGTGRRGDQGPVEPIAIEPPTLTGDALLSLDQMPSETPANRTPAFSLSAAVDGDARPS
jgi:hypothetical protein